MEDLIAPVLNQKQARLTIGALRGHADMLVVVATHDVSLTSSGRHCLRKRAADLTLIADHIADAFDPRKPADDDERKAA